MMESDLDRASAVARILAAAPVDEIARIGMGRNSRVYRVRAGGKNFALKKYPARDGDPRDRLATEVGALALIEQAGIDEVPRVRAVDQAQGFVLMTWIEGAPIGDADDSDIDAAIAFLADILSAGRLSGSAAQPPAAEACLSGGEIERQIRGRLARLEELAGGEPGLSLFLGAQFRPALECALAAAKEGCARAGLDFHAALDPEHRALIPADFGFHNALRRPGGGLAFLDFEYFGWDDPAKLAADTLLHPATALSPRARRRFRTGAERIYGKDHRFRGRLAAYLPLFGLRWAMILLNEFDPLRWRRRASAEGESWDAVKLRQLAKAKAFLARLEDSGLGA